MFEINDKFEVFLIIVFIFIVVIFIVFWIFWNKDKVKLEKIYLLVYVINFEIYFY